MHPRHTLGDINDSLIERGSKYPTPKRSPCDINYEGPKTKFTKFVIDQNPKHFENIAVMKGGEGVMNE